MRCWQRSSRRTPQAALGSGAAPSPPPPSLARAGTYPLQSERFYQALKGHGAPARLVILPHESHGYQARESILHCLYEQDKWLERWLRGNGD